MAPVVARVRRISSTLRRNPSADLRTRFVTLLSPRESYHLALVHTKRGRREKKEVVEFAARTHPQLSPQEVGPREAIKICQLFLVVIRLLDVNRAPGE